MSGSNSKLIIAWFTEQDSAAAAAAAAGKISTSHQVRPRLRGCEQGRQEKQEKKNQSGVGEQQSRKKKKAAVWPGQEGEQVLEQST